MSQKSANMARRLFAAAGSDERWVMGDEAQSAAEVMHKEGKKEKETFPPTPPYKEKEKREETTGSGSGSGSRVRVRVGPDTFFDPDLDPVTVAVTVFGGDRDDRRLWRWYLYRIGEDTSASWRSPNGVRTAPTACRRTRPPASSANSPPPSTRNPPPKGEMGDG